jgi:ferrochelatase
MVFLNMGGPSKTEDVEDFLSRLFVCLIGVPTGRMNDVLLTQAHGRLMAT